MSYSWISECRDWSCRGQALLPGVPEDSGKLIHALHIGVPAGTGPRGDPGTEAAPACRASIGQGAVLAPHRHLAARVKVLRRTRERDRGELALATVPLIFVCTEGTFGRLRYSLGGDRPSQTVHQTLFP